MTAGEFIDVYNTQPSKLHYRFLQTNYRHVGLCGHLLLHWHSA